VLLALSLALGWCAARIIEQSIRELAWLDTLASLLDGDAT
jgi:hypothetical protein